MLVFHFNTLRILVGMIAVCFTVYGKDLEKKKASYHRFKMQNLDMAVVFEDQNLSNKEKTVMLNDYHLVLGHLRPQGRNVAAKKSLIRTEMDLEVTETIHFVGEYKKRPDGYEGLFGVIGRSNDGQEYIVIPKKLSRAYKEVLEFKSVHKEAFSKLKLFIDLMNNLENRQLPPIREMFYLNEESQKSSGDDSDAKPSDFLKAYAPYQYAQASLLDLKIKKWKESTFLISKMFILQKGSGKQIGELPIIFAAGRWKLLATKFGM